MSATIDPADHTGGTIRDVEFFEHGDDLLAAYTNENGTTYLYRVTGETRNPRTTVLADAIVDDGKFLTVYPEGALLTYQHPYAGIQRREVAHEWFDEPVLLLEELPRRRGSR